VASCTVKGELGLFEGAVHDEAALGAYLRNKTYNAAYQALVIDRVFKGGAGTYMDIGANIGFTVIPLARARPGVQCHAFEPEPQNFLFLRKNIAAHGVEQTVRLYNLAAFSQECTLAFELAASHSGDHRVRTGRAIQEALLHEDERQVIEVKATRLDSLFNLSHLAHPVMIKMDTQGSEVQIFRGGEKLLKEADFLYAEFAPYWIRRVGDSPEEYLDILRASGFRWGWTEGENLEFHPLARRIDDVLDELRQFVGQSKRTEYTNVFVSRSTM
jgi:FkbM family methyltransferase